MGRPLAVPKQIKLRKDSALRSGRQGHSGHKRRILCMIG